MFSFMLVKTSSIIATNTMSLSVDATTSLGTTNSEKHVKLELIIFSWVDPLYETPPKIIFDKKTLPSKKEISKKYVDLCNKRLTPKHLKVGRDLLEEEVEALFGTSMNKNGYQYWHTNDEEMITIVENLFMVIHQQTQVLNTHMINKAEARGIICKRKGNTNTKVRCSSLALISMGP